MNKPKCHKCGEEIEWNKVHICEVPKDAIKGIKEE